MPNSRRRLEVLGRHINVPCHSALSLFPKEKTEKVSRPSESTVLHRRNASVLQSNRILKYDHFPELKEQQQGVAPNFRKVSVLVHGVTVHLVGCAQPNLQGIRGMISQNVPGPILWVNCRSEPVLYIEDDPFSVRKRRDPFNHLKWEWATVQDKSREKRLKMEVLNEADEYGGSFMAHDERAGTHEKPGEVFLKWIDLGRTWKDRKKKVQTVQEVFDEVSDKVTFVRWPVDDERPPKEECFDELIRHVNKFLAQNRKHRHADLTIVFNCHQGRGRTTTGLVLAHLSLSSLSAAVGHMHMALHSDNESDKAADDAVEDLVGVLAEGRKAQTLADASIKTFTHTIDLKSSIKEKHDKWKAKKTQKSEDSYLRYVHRYKYIMLFASYLLEPIECKGTDGSDGRFEYVGKTLVQSCGGRRKVVTELRSDASKTEIVEVATNGDTHEFHLLPQDVPKLVAMAVRADVPNNLPREQVRCKDDDVALVKADRRTGEAGSCQVCASGPSEFSSWWKCSMCDYSLCEDCFEKRKRKLDSGFTFEDWVKGKDEELQVYSFLGFDKWADGK